MFYFILLYFSAFSNPDPASIRESFQSYDVDSLQREEIFQVDPKLSDLGQLLFFDKILSGNKNISCATCHHPNFGSSDGLALPFGEGATGLGTDRVLGEGRLIPRNAPATFNMIYPSFHTAMWDGRISFSGEIVKSPEPELNVSRRHEFIENIENLATLQALFPVTSHDEMRGKKGTNDVADASDNFEVWDILTERVLSIPEYAKKFKDLFPYAEEFNFSHVSSAIGAFEMFAFEASNSLFDHFMEGDNTALTKNQMIGAEIFLNKGKCIECHTGSHFTDFKFHSISAPQLGPGKEAVSNKSFGEDFGLFLQTELFEDKYKFKTPSLRNVSLTGPWMHSGAFDKLEDVIFHHANAFVSLNEFIVSPSNYIERIEFLSVIDRDLWSNKQRLNSQSPLLDEIDLTEKEILLVVEFLESLKDSSFKYRVKVPKTVPSGLSVED